MRVLALLIIGFVIGLVLSASGCIEEGTFLNVVRTQEHPREESFFARASWYGIPYHGRTMANGRTFNMYDPQTVAHKTLPFGTRLLLTNLANGRQITAIVRDRGPFIEGRALDLSMAGAEKLGFKQEGLTLLKAVVIAKP
ncbi:MAG: hypothetical protein A3C80_04525 [Candidatus Ryanbacteria bacterium RIFCSPHIGHO2_02_FULL_45_43]|uniref:Probable endolytic peptidoglycan transglycosylase RlpA n=1 Tax=Candidatus Ryanbacteria bacterium RIFCSPHIGHO2_01_45_13 TaxID=1802112 RepID=A0A1G2G028_9BACT|nr:MAG: hypothetical protein A2718_04425 [Candidatus Ryanbacteria bacterium RIFCSPHIGHO2_01_FULL_44_130]OGZ43656.1 MAG: hypothetical protein A2W41_04915 [Candidatus Ryanbacteria bacterium RIFCSPHIGHO2_01_45_13]OGZ49139.1 MAG: hypothetical protein A3C80_04525 [Candidatus Ryanbacteria bacterium RIFCSPHIGHO2_02_FULL_45_43]OGZ50920.1 MAG: hypothetical protein A3E55_00595 [Candidatus Ryanbacteria bacterium RIFCSPHIGHO2_12_FULL_44_20]OGZ51399.1 MAG: hypothetical protein A3A17_00225 [Candidatus Ryanba